MDADTTDYFVVRQCRTRILVELPGRHDRNRHSGLGEPESQVRKHTAGGRLVRKEIAVDEH